MFTRLIFSVGLANCCFSTEDPECFYPGTWVLSGPGKPNSFSKCGWAHCSGLEMAARTKCLLESEAGGNSFGLSNWMKSIKPFFLDCSFRLWIKDCFDYKKIDYNTLDCKRKRKIADFYKKFVPYWKGVGKGSQKTIECEFLSFVNRIIFFFI